MCVMSCVHPAAVGTLGAPATSEPGDPELLASWDSCSLGGAGSHFFPQALGLC